MKKSQFPLPLALLVILLSGCSQAYRAKSEYASPESAVQQQTVASTKKLDLRRVIRSGSVSVRVKSTVAAEKAIVEMLYPGPGYVESSNLSGFETGVPRIVMKIRVPSAEFETSMERLAALGTLLAKQIETKDVTAEIADLGAVVKTLVAKEDSFREMLRASRNSNEIVNLQDKLTQVRTEIDRIQAQEKALGALADLSTIEVTLVQEHNTSAAPNDPEWFGQGIASALASFMSLFRGVATLLTWIVVFSPFWLPGIAVAVLFSRRRLRRPPIAKN